MDLHGMPKKKRRLVVALLIVPVIISIFSLFYIGIDLHKNALPGERFSPVDNKPLIIALVITTLGYIFFLGMLFSENLLELFNRRRSFFRH